MRPAHLIQDSRAKWASTIAPLERFLLYCQHDPGTGCVLWTGGTTAGRGKRARYGIFWFEGAPWRAHRWAAKHIHGQDIDDMQVDHCCPPYRTGDWLPPDTLCVQHVQSVPPLVNRELQWIRVQVGLQAEPPACEEAFNSVPFYTAPRWLEMR